jgi:hypothetical protein
MENRIAKRAGKIGKQNFSVSIRKWRANPDGEQYAKENIIK